MPYTPVTFSPYYGGMVGFGIAAESTAGTPVTTPTIVYYPSKPENNKPKYNPDRKPIEFGRGTAWADYMFFDGESTTDFTIDVPTYPALTALLLTQAGAAAGTDPLPFTSWFAYKGQAIQVAGCFIDQLDLMAKSSDPVMLRLTCKAITAPLMLAEVTPTLTSYTEKPFLWSNAQPATLIGSSTVKSVDDITVTLKHNLIAVRANAGSQFPSHMVPGKKEASCKFTKLWNTTAEYYDFLNLVVATTPTQFVFTNTATTPKTLTAALASTVYKTQEFGQAVTAAVKETYEAQCQAPTDGTSPWSLAIA